MDWTILSRYLGLWVLFGVVHSVLAMDWVKQRIRLDARIYRLIYNIIQTVVFLYVVFQMPSISSVVLSGFSLAGARFWLFLLLLASGGVTAGLGLLAWDLFAFAGLKREEGGLNTRGIYAFSRHPVYIGSILVFLSALVVQVSEGTLGWLIGAGGYFVIGSIFEEQKLRKAFDGYREYSENVGWMFPWRSKHLQYLQKNFR